MLVEIEAGYAKNEPVTYAVRKAIEAGVVELIKQGAIKELWKYAGPTEEELLALAEEEEKIQDELDILEAELQAEEEAEIHADEISTLGVAELHSLTKDLEPIVVGQEEESADVEDNEDSANHPLPSDIAP